METWLREPDRGPKRKQWNGQQSLRNRRASSRTCSRAAVRKRDQRRRPRHRRAANCCALCLPKNAPLADTTLDCNRPLPVPAARTAGKILRAKLEIAEEQVDAAQGRLKTKRPEKPPDSRRKPESGAFLIQSAEVLNRMPSGRSRPTRPARAVGANIRERAQEPRSQNLRRGAASAHPSDLARRPRDAGSQYRASTMRFRSSLQHRNATDPGVTFSAKAGGGRAWCIGPSTRS